MSKANILEKEKTAIEALLHEINRADLFWALKKANELIEIASADNCTAIALYRKWARFLSNEHFNITILPIIEREIRERLATLEASIAILGK
jgi:hypothetical protein